MDSCFISYLFSNPSPSADLDGSPPINLEVRQARMQDLKSLAEILTDSFFPAYKFWWWTRPIFKLGIYEDLKGRLRSEIPHYCCLVVTGSSGNLDSPEIVIATAEIGLKTSSFFSTAIPYISNLAVRSDFRRRGIARKLLTKCERVAAEWGFAELSLHVLDNNTAARELYYSSGYSLQRVDRGLSSLLFNQPKRLFLHKTLLTVTGE